MMPRYALGIGDRPCLLAVSFLLQDTRHKPGNLFLNESGDFRIYSPAAIKNLPSPFLLSEGFVPVPLKYLIAI